MLTVLVAAISLMGFLGFTALSDISDSAPGLEQAGIEGTRTATTRAQIAGLQSAIQLQVTSDDPRLAAQNRAAVEAAIARLELRLSEKAHAAGNHPIDRSVTAEQQRGLRQLVDRWRSGALEVRRGRSNSSGAPESAAALRVQRLVAPMLRASDALAKHDSDQAEDAAAHAPAVYAKTRNLMIVDFTATMLLAIALFFWLIRSIVPRARRYSRFAAEVAAGNPVGHLDPAGGDELSDLGHSLDDMVARHERERDYQRTQGEFADVMQASESEEEAHDLMKRHLERSIPGSSALVLSRNNSDDRLEPQKGVEPCTALRDGLEDAKPRSCLAIRSGRSHEGGGDRAPLLNCKVCGRTPDISTCSPLLVSGEVIGSVLVNHPEELGGHETLRIRESVSQAAPVLANLRNLAIAELRAATDALTGLANRRAVQDTLTRMVAHSARAGTPLAAVLVDLDRFKQINDTYGHGRGDEVLATAADALRSAVRASDFVGRYGGEEFLVLLPDTDLKRALEVAESIRSTVATLELAELDKPVTASLGVAVMPADGTDSDALIRNADRALYSAKQRGRNRVETSGAATTGQAVPDLPPVLGEPVH